MNIRRKIIGICSVECDAAAAVRLMNICSHRGIRTWCDRRRKFQGFYIYRTDSKTVKEVSERCGLEITMKEVKSLRTFVEKNRTRISFAAGVLIFGILVYIQSLYIWHIDISGCENYTSEEILHFIQLDYPCVGKRKNTINPEKLRDRLMENYSDICWASCSMSGTKLTVNIKESVDVFTDIDASEPSNLIAAMDCTIYSIVTSSGTPVATAGDEVKKGDILISGMVNICNDDSEVVETKFVAAQGQIYGVCKLPYSDKVDAVHYVKVPMKDKIKEIELVTGNRVVSLYDSGKNNEYEDLCTRQHCLHVGDFYMPIAINICRSIPYKLKTEKYDEKRLKQLAEEHLMTYIGKMQEKGVQILQKNVIITNGCDSVTAEGELTVIRPVAVPDVISDADK